MIKFRMYFDKDAETTWLNEMAAEGWAMKSYFAGFYGFEKCEPGEYIYQIDIGKRFGRVSSDYREFMKELDVEVVLNWGLWILLRKPASKGAFELYTDPESSIEHYSNIRKVFKVGLIIELICFLVELFVGIAGNSWGYALAMVIFLVMFPMINALQQTNSTLAKLQEKTGTVNGKHQANVSPLLSAGMLMNLAALLIQESVPQPIKLTLQIIAIFMMLFGIAQMSKSNR